MTKTFALTEIKLHLCLTTNRQVAQVLGVSLTALNRWPEQLTRLNLHRIRKWAVDSGCRVVADAATETLRKLASEEK
jgi:hypothetical protein